jgi:parallel beta-helix repeat protein
MPQKFFSSIRSQSATLNLSKGGSTSLYVDQTSSKASDDNDGYDWFRPKKTVMGAMLDAAAWAFIFIRGGVYAENVVIPYENVTLIGIVQAGVDRAEIAPSSGVPITVQCGYCEIRGLSIVGTNSNCIVATGPGLNIHDCYIEVDSDGSAQYTEIVLDDCDSFHIWNNSFNGMSVLNVIGIRVDGTTNASVDGVIEKNYLLNFGSVGVAGQGINLNNAQRCLVKQNIFDSGYNGIYLENMANALHTIVGNQFYANASYDVCDMNTDPVTSGISIRNNFYGYSGWFSDVNHDGIADKPVSCYNGYDYCPLSSPHYLGPSFIPRVVY